MKRMKCTRIVFLNMVFTLRSAITNVKVTKIPEFCCLYSPPLKPIPEIG